MKFFLILYLLFIVVITSHAQLPPVFDSQLAQAAQNTETTTKYLTPVKITWQSECAGRCIANAEQLLLPGNGQADLSDKDMCILKSENGSQPSLLLDFGKEIHGGLQLVTGMSPSGKPIRVRVRFGESASEAMSEIGPDKTATNDHAIRDAIVLLPWLGKLEIGNTGFRFVRIDLLDASTELHLKEVRAIFIFRHLPWLGSFKCNDSLLNKIWQTGAYTVQLNMQDYLWDGIKRDRLVWVGDMHPEIVTICNVFGYNDVVPKSLDFIRDITPLPGWMNGISTYSMWWIIIHRDWYYHNGNLSYLKQQKSYLLQLLNHLISKIGVDDKEHLDGNRFLDWPSSENKRGVDAGIQAMMIWALTDGADLCNKLGEFPMAARCISAVSRLKKNLPDPNNLKQAAALMALTELWPAQKANDEVLAVNGAKGFSTFYGYYMLQAMAKAGNYQGAIDVIRDYWGAMLNLGATTFWEDFNIDWLPNASRIDELPKADQKDIHGDYGNYCYRGFRHSLCHGWASGPTPWLMQHVLGITVVEPGCKTIRIVPHLGDLQFAEGSFPTPYGIIKVKHVKQANGKIISTIKAPKQIKILRK